MGDYDRTKFRQIMVDADLYGQLDKMRGPDDTFADVIRRLIGSQSDTRLKKGRSIKELLLLAKVANSAWRRKVASGQVKYIVREE